MNRVSAPASACVSAVTLAILLTGGALGCSSSPSQPAVLGTTGDVDATADDASVAEGGGSVDTGSGAEASLASPCSVSDNVLYFEGTRNDSISGGSRYTLTAGKDNSAGFGGNSTNAVSLAFPHAGNNGFDLSFAAPMGQVLTPGTYANATRYPFNAPGPGLSLSGDGRGCNTLIGEATFVGDIIARLSATFVQHCEGSKTDYLSGCVSFTQFVDGGAGDAGGAGDSGGDGAPMEGGSRDAGGPDGG